MTKFRVTVWFRVRIGVYGLDFCIGQQRSLYSVGPEPNGKAEYIRRDLFKKIIYSPGIAMPPVLPMLLSICNVAPLIRRRVDGSHPGLFR